MKIVFNEVTWYSKLAAVIFFIGVLPVLTFCIGKQYGEVMALSNQPIYNSPDPQNIVITHAPPSAPQENVQYFTASTPINQGPGTYSNIVGYFASGNFFFYVPQWIPDHWKMENLPDGGMSFTLNQPISTQKDFSDIVISVSTTTEKINAETLFSKRVPKNDKATCLADTRCEVRDANSSIITSEILLSRVGDTRIYHIAESQSDGTIEDTYYIDGNLATATITFSADAGAYPQYENIIRDFVQGIGKGEGARG
jgi:hypothetical protein